MAQARSRTRSVPLPVVDLRPQSVLLVFFGDYVSASQEVVAAAAVIDVLESAGVGASATRATLSRMVKRGLLLRTAVGRQAYFGLTEFGRRTVLEGRTRAQDGDVVDREWEGRWTLVAFSLPEESQRQRHLLRSRLTWAGFGMVQAGLWAAPHTIDVDELVADLDARDFVTAFRAEPVDTAQTTALVGSAFDLGMLSARYEGFLARWRPFLEADDDSISHPLTARVVLSADWLMVLRGDPRLPLQLLPDPWPGVTALELHRALESRLRASAEGEARSRLDITTIPSVSSVRTSS